MPQKGYLSNKKSLPKLIDSNAQPENVDSSPKMPTSVINELFSLYIRGPAWIKDRDNAANRLKNICPKIKDVRHPRQKSADYCFIDFTSATERDESFEELKGNAELTVKSVTKDVPKLLQKRKKKILEKREAKKETRNLLAKIKKNQQKEEHPKERTNQLIIANLPAQATSTELKQLFPDSININMKLKKKAKKMNSAIITFPDPDTAFSASKASIELHGHKLNSFLNIDANFKAQAKNKTRAKRKKSMKLDSTKESDKKIAKV